MRPGRGQWSAKANTESAEAAVVTKGDAAGPAQGALGALAGRGSQREELLPAGGGRVQGSPQEPPPPAPAAPVGAPLGPRAPAPLWGAGCQRTRTTPCPPPRLASSPRGRASRTGQCVRGKPQTVGAEDPGPRPAHSGGGGAHLAQRPAVAPHHRLGAQGHGPCGFLQRPARAPSHRPAQGPAQGLDGH